LAAFCRSFAVTGDAMDFTKRSQRISEGYEIRSMRYDRAERHGKTNAEARELCCQLP
jgi:hypothetical protein